jgi:uncharacterized membrane protein YbhN (UPF0104 family)
MADGSALRPGKVNRNRRTSTWRWIRLLVGVALTGASLYFLGARLLRDWGNIPFGELHFRPLVLVASFAFLLLLHLPLNGLAWHRILAATGGRISWLHATAILSVAQIGKYAPGKVWFTLGRMAMAEREGVSQDRTMVSVLVEVGFALLAAVALLGLAVLLIPRSLLHPAVYWLFLLAPATAAATYPPLLNRILSFALTRLRRPVFRLEMSYLQILGTVGLYLLDWLIQGLGCFILINSFYPLPLGKLPVLLGGYAMSWMLGFLVLVAPAGLGVREGIYTIILRTVMPEPVAIISALITRVWMTVSELVMAGVCLPVVLRRRKNAPQA